MGATQKRLCALLVFIIVIIEVTGIDINDTSTDENRRSPGRGRIIKRYSGTRPEPIFCTGEGFQSDPHNCGTFYRCVKSGNDKYTVFRFQCGPGTVYDPDEKVCNHPQNTRRAECGGFLPPIINDSHSNEIQGQMNNEIPSPMEPIYPTNTLQQSTMSPYPWGSSTNPSYTDHNAMRPISAESNMPHTISRDNVCTSDGFMGDSENCRKFYRCVGNQRGGYTRYEFSCAESTIWDDYNQICNHIWAVRKTRCSFLNDKITMTNTNFHNENPHSWDNNDTKKPNKIPNNTVQNQLQISYGTQVTQTQTQISNGIVNQNQTQMNYGDRLNQEKNEVNRQNQTQISNGSAISQSQIQIDYGNKGVQTQLQIDHSNNASQNQIQIIGSSTNKVSTTIHNSDNQESDKHDSLECTETGFIGDNTDCTKFYRCIDNGQGGFKKFGFTCAEGTAWDPSLKTCNRISALNGCNLSFIPSTTQTLTTTADKTTQTTTTSSTERTTPQLTSNDNESTGYGYPKPEPTPTSSLSPTLTTIFDAKYIDCTSSGFMGDENNCKIFYRCVENGSGGFTKYMFNCGEGTVWDPEIKACNHEWAVEKCGGNASPDINKIDTTTAKVISSSAVYVQSTAATEENNEVGYGSSNNNIQTSTLSSKYPANIQPDENSTENDKTTSTSTTKSVLKDNGKCTHSGFMGDPNDCKKFFRCVDNGSGSYTKFEFRCGEGTLWDDEIKSCNHAWAVAKCGGSSGSSPNNDAINNNYTSENNTEPSVVITTSTTENSAVTNPSNINFGKNETSFDCTEEGFTGDPNNCKIFYRCVDDGEGNFLKYRYNCGEGTHWNQEILSCDHLTDNKTCKGINGSLTTSTENTIISGDESHQQNPTPQPPNSPVICTSEGFYGNKNDCKQFYRCVDNGNGDYDIYYFNCGEGTVWDQELLTCNHESLTECTSLALTDNRPPPENFTTTSTTTMGSVMHDEESTQSTQTTTRLETTNNETTASQPSTASTTIVSSTTQTSTPNFEHSSNSDLPNTDTCNDEGFYGNTQDCKKFYRCVSNGKGGYTKYDFDCAEGTIWDKDVTTCNHPENVVHPSCNLTQDSNSTDESSTTNQETSKNPSINCTKAGFFANPNDCKKFYRCVDWDGNETKFSIYHFECGEGTIWDPAIETCNHEDSVYPPRDCSGSESQFSTTEGTATTKNESTTLSISQTTSESTTTQSTTESISQSTNVSTSQSVTELTTPSATESITTSITELTTSSATQSTTPPTTESTTLLGTELTTPSVTESTTESSTHSATESTPTSITESTNPSATESITMSTTESTTLLPTEESKTSSVTESTTFSVSEPTITSTTEPTTLPATESTSLSTTESTTISTTKLTTLSITESTTESSTLSATESTPTSITESTVPSATESTATSTTESTTTSVTESTTTLPTESTTPSPSETTTFTATESTSTLPTELTTPSATETTTFTATESTTLSTTESTAISTTESTTTLVTESTTTLPTESTTLTATELTTHPVTESTTHLTTESTTTSTIESTTPSVTDSTTTSNNELTTLLATELVTPSTTESTTASNTESTTLSATESTTLSVTESSTSSVTETTAPSVTESITSSVTESTTPSITESTTTSTSESTTLSATESTTKSTTESSTISATELISTSSTESTTFSATESATFSATESTSPSTTESTTTSTTESSTLPTTESTTMSTAESTILSTTESTTESTTKSTTESTVSTSGEQTTTERPEEGTTGQSTQSTTEYSTQSTTEHSVPSTTEQLGESTTTERSESSTTEKSGESTTESLGGSTTENSQNTSTGKPSPEDCPVTEDDQYLFVCPSSFRRHPKYCNLFYQCDESEDTHDIKIAMFTCPNNTIYDESKTKCVEESKAQKRCDGEVAQKHRVKRRDRIGNNVNDPIEVTEDSYACTSAGYYAFEKDGDCSPGFFKCMVTKTNKLRGLVYQCPAGYLFWTVSRRCEPMYKINNCRRTAINNWSRRWEIPVERRNVAW